MKVVSLPFKKETLFLFCVKSCKVSPLQVFKKLRNKVII